MIDGETARSTLEEIRSLAASLTSDRAMREIVDALSRLPGYDWVGFYFLSDKDPGILELGTFIGAPTEHKRIPLNQGICGAALSEQQTIVVDDVRQDPRYLACSIATKSEIVAPIFAGGKIVGELDIDSHQAAAFGDHDRTLAEGCAALVGEALEKKAA